MTLTMTEIHRMEVARMNILRHEATRRRAVAEFPLRVMRLASDLKQMCDLFMHDPAPPTQDTIEAMNYIERAIRQEFRMTFGTEMIPENVNTATQ